MAKIWVYKIPCGDRSSLLPREHAAPGHGADARVGGGGWTCWWCSQDCVIPRPARLVEDKLDMGIIII